MKLIFCPECQDVVRLIDNDRSCKCSKSSGHYIDDINAVYKGKAIPLGFANTFFMNAIRNQPKEGMGKIFEAFVIPKKCPTFKKVK